MPTNTEAQFNCNLRVIIWSISTDFKSVHGCEQLGLLFKPNIISKLCHLEQIKMVVLIFSTFHRLFELVFKYAVDMLVNEPSKEISDCRGKT